MLNPSELKNLLSEFGKVTKCQVVKDEFHVAIGKGFTGRLGETVKLLKLLTETVGAEYPVVGKTTTDANKFEMVFKKPSK